MRKLYALLRNPFDVTKIGVEDDYFKIEFSGDNIHVGDEYHTMDELYDHRMMLFTVLCNCIESHDNWSPHAVSDKVSGAWKSLLHHDGTMFGPEWFIMGIQLKNGKQITYHLKVEPYWSLARFVPQFDRAPEYDGHTSEDVLERLMMI